MKVSRWVGVFLAPALLFPASPAYSDEGIASWYGGGEKLNERTANGDIFNPSAYTCASWDYPFGTILRVSSAEVGPKRSVVVIVNDRGPARWLKRKIDLSRSAFKELAPLEKGTLFVQIEPITPDGRKR